MGGESAVVAPDGFPLCSARRPRHSSSIPAEVFLESWPAWAVLSVLPVISQMFLPFGGGQQIRLQLAVTA